MKEILKAYKKELSQDLLKNKQFIYSWLDQSWFDDWIKYRSRTVDGLIELFVVGPWRVSIWWPFLIIAYLWNRLIAYTFIPLLVITTPFPKVHKFIWIIEKFLKTFFGFFWIAEAFPKAKERSAEKWLKRIEKFQKFSKEFQRNGPQMVDDFYADFQRRIYDVYENNVIHGLNLLKPIRRKLENRYIEKLTTIKVMYKIRRERVPLAFKLWIDTWKYRFEILKVWLKMPKEVIYCKTLRIARYISTGFRAIFIVVQGLLLTVEIILIPERISLNIRLKLKDLRYKIRMLLIRWL